MGRGSQVEAFWFDPHRLLQILLRIYPWAQGLLHQVPSVMMMIHVYHSILLFASKSLEVLDR